MGYICTFYLVFKNKLTNMQKIPATCERITLGLHIPFLLKWYTAKSVDKDCF